MVLGQIRPARTLLPKSRLAIVHASLISAYPVEDREHEVRHQNVRARHTRLAGLAGRQGLA